MGQLLLGAALLMLALLIRLLMQGGEYSVNENFALQSAPKKRLRAALQVLSAVRQPVCLCILLLRIGEE